jgi:hypothetical protein
VPTIDKLKLDMSALDKFKADLFNADAFKLDGAAGGDPYTKALLHMNGADASTTFTDEKGKTWTRYGNAQIDTSQKKFGTAASLFDGTGDWIDTPSSEDFNVGSGDFTIDFWFRLGALGVDQFLFGQCDSGMTDSSLSMRFRILSDNTPYLYVYQGTNLYVTSVATALTTGLFYHAALVRYGNTITYYLDGVAKATANVAGVTINSSPYKFALGRPGEFAGGYFTGWIDEFRFSKGIARWTANFTPPASEYTA